MEGIEVHHELVLMGLEPFIQAPVGNQIILFRITPEEEAELRIQHTLIKWFFMGDHLCPVAFRLV